MFHPLLHAACLLLASTALAADPVFHALKTDGSTVTGRVVRIGEEVALAKADGVEEAIPLARLVKLSRDGEGFQSPVEGTQLLFPDGDRLKAAIGAMDETKLEVTPPGLDGDAPLAVPLDAILAVALAPPAETEALERFLDLLRREPRAADVLWLANGDRQSGTVLTLTPQKVEYQADAGPVALDRAGVVALAFDPKAVRYPRPRGTYLELTWLDGSRLGISAARLDDGRITGTTRFGAPVRVPIGELSRIHARSDSVSYLSERDESAVQYQGYVAPPPPYRRDASVEGRPIRLAGQPFDRGIGMQGRTLVAYRLAPEDKRFQATIGLDDRAGPQGAAVFRVRVDGDERFASPPLAAGEQPRAIDVDVSGAKVLILMTEFGPRGEVRDLADWAEARLVR